MRLLLFFFCCAAFCGILSCSKNISSVTHLTSCEATPLSSVAGSWEMRSWQGGKSVHNSGEAEPGNGNIYNFTATRFEHYENHILLDSGTFTIIKSGGPEGGSPLDAFLFHETDTLLFSLDSDTLILDPRAPSYDGIARKYVKVYQN